MEREWGAGERERKGLGEEGDKNGGGRDKNRKEKPSNRIRKGDGEASYLAPQG